ncbi:MAG: penicillin-binding protein 2 [bacterium]|nr:penicillin-binding protein 2 [bacterium]
MSVTTNPDVRLRVVFGFVCFVAFAIVIRLFVLMVLQHKSYLLLAEKSHGGFSELFPSRGSIYIQDSRTGEEYPLAINRDFFTVYADTREIKDDQTAENVAEKMAEIFGYDDEAKLALYYKINKRDDPYEPIEKKVDEETVDKLRGLELQGIGYVRKAERYYPENNLASHVVGFLGKDEAGQNTGQYGIEGYWDTTLRGTGGFFSGDRSAGGGIINVIKSSFKSPEDGPDILLTIDRTLQYMACERLRNAMAEYKASSASLIILDPFSGAIRAMCSLPDFDPNIYNEVESIKIYNNTTIFTPYEPGSIFKPIPMSAAINEGLLKPETEFFDSGSVDAGCSKSIKNAGNKSYQQQNMIGVLENSINTGMVFVAEKLGKKKLSEYIVDFGFGIKEGIELDSEITGNIDTLNKNMDRDFDCYAATASFGQGITATPLQMASAFGAIANGGVLIKPYIVEELRYPNGKLEKTKVKEIRKVLDKRTTSLVGGMLVNVIDSGQARRAGVKGYYVAGKTGTAQIAGAGGYTEDTNHSFVGFAPVDDPKFVMIVKFEKPEVVYSASTAAPVFGDIAKFALQYYQVPPAR